MRFLFITLPALILINLFAAKVIAQPGATQIIQVKPGLWNVVNFVGLEKYHPQYKTVLARKEGLLANMLPEKRKEMEETLGDISAPASLGGGQFCITHAMAQRNEVVLNGDSCGNVHAKREENTMRYSYKCKGGSKNSGDGMVTFLSDTAYTTRTRLITHDLGKLDNLNAASVANFLSSDCGNIKPRTVTAPSDQG